MNKQTILSQVLSTLPPPNLVQLALMIIKYDMHSKSTTTIAQTISNHDILTIHLFREGNVCLGHGIADLGADVHDALAEQSKYQETWEHIIIE